MKAGKTLQQMAQELERQVATRKDYVADQGAVQVDVIDGELMLAGVNGGPKAITAHAHLQMADHLVIPTRYYQRMMAEQPKLLADNVNTWLHQDGGNKRMIRTLDGKVRAFLSPKYRPLDNFELANAVLPTLIEHGVEIASCELTETRMYIKGILPELSEELPEGMTWGQGHQMVGRDGRLVAALTISNSEVGAGSLRVEPGVFTTWCTNLAVMKQAAMKKYHVGRSSTADDAMEIFRDETRQADDRAFFLKVQDVVGAAFSRDQFLLAIAQIRDAAKDPIRSDDLPKVVEITVKELALPSTTQNSILKALASGGDLSRWGLSSAITQVANTFPDYEGATALERAGGEVLALNGRGWDQISNAAA
jgi:hypothetical protein